MSERAFGIPVLVACMGVAPLAASAGDAAQAKVYTFQLEADDNGAPASLQLAGEGDATSLQLQRELSKWLVERDGAGRVTTFVRVNAVPASADAPARILSATTGPAPKALSLPDYPSNARRLGHEGVVVVEVAMDASGAVGDARVHDTFGKVDRAMANAALAAARQWSFRPERIDGAPQAAKLLMPVCFTVGQGKACEWTGPNDQALGRDSVVALAPAARLANPANYALK